MKCKNSRLGFLKFLSELKTNYWQQLRSYREGKASIGSRQSRADENSDADGLLVKNCGAKGRKDLIEKLPTQVQLGDGTGYGGMIPLRG